MGPLGPVEQVVFSVILPKAAIGDFQALAYSWDIKEVKQQPIYQTDGELAAEQHRRIATNGHSHTPRMLPAPADKGRKRTCKTVILDYVQATYRKTRQGAAVPDIQTTVKKAKFSPRQVSGLLTKLKDEKQIKKIGLGLWAPYDSKPKTIRTVGEITGRELLVGILAKVPIGQSMAREELVRRFEADGKRGNNVDSILTYLVGQKKIFRPEKSMAALTPAYHAEVNSQ